MNEKPPRIFAGAAQPTAHEPDPHLTHERNELITFLTECGKAVGQDFCKNEENWIPERRAAVLVNLGKGASFHAIWTPSLLKEGISPPGYTFKNKAWPDRRTEEARELFIKQQGIQFCSTTARDILVPHKIDAFRIILNEIDTLHCNTPAQSQALRDVAQRYQLIDPQPIQESTP